MRDRSRQKLLDFEAVMTNQCTSAQVLVMENSSDESLVGDESQSQIERERQVRAAEVEAISVYDDLKRNHMNSQARQGQRR